MMVRPLVMEVVVEVVVVKMWRGVEWCMVERRGWSAREGDGLVGWLNVLYLVWRQLNHIIASSY